MKPKTPKQAKALGLKYYETGKACKNGEVYKRYINGNCLCQKCAEERYVRIFGSQREYKFRRRKASKHPELDTNARNRLWKKQNKEKVNVINAFRRSAKLRATPKWFGELDQFVVEEAYELVERRNKTTGIKWSVDHMIPLQAKEACGLHCYQNIQVIPEKLNCMKRNKMILTEPMGWL